MRVKSLMVPPGVPDWATRLRYLRPGPVEIVGRAWSGSGVPIAKVEFNDGSGWQTANVTQADSPYAWSKWSVEWDATPGEYVLSCRATDANGDTQPLEPPWDASGFGNNAVHTVNVYVAGE